MADSDKYLDKPGLGHLIGLIKGAIGGVQGAVDELEKKVDDAGGVSADGVTIKKSASGVLSAIMDVAGGVTSLARHNADIVVDDGSTTVKSGNALSVRDGGVKSAHLSDGCVTTGKIASKAVTSDKLADGSVETSAIADGAVTPEKISDLAELRGEMGLGYTLGALPVESGGTGKTSIADAVYPVGSIYMSVNPADPGTLFGGTWQRIQDRFLLASGSSYAAGATGGEASHALTVGEMPSHTHPFEFWGGSANTSATQQDGEYLALLTQLNAKLCTQNEYSPSYYISASRSVSSAGGGSAHNNMPPYLAVYAWERTA